MFDDTANEAQRLIENMDIAVSLTAFLHSFVTSLGGISSLSFGIEEGPQLCRLCCCLKVCICDSPEKVMRRKATSKNRMACGLLEPDFCFNVHLNPFRGLFRC